MSVGSDRGTVGWLEVKLHDQGVDAIPKIYADFQNLDDANRLRLDSAGTLEDLERQGVRLTDGLVVTLYTDDANDRGEPDEMRAEGIVRYDGGRDCWVAEIDWDGLRHASDEPVSILESETD